MDLSLWLVGGHQTENTKSPQSDKVSTSGK